jgi:hypothetical protein
VVRVSRSPGRKPAKPAMGLLRWLVQLLIMPAPVYVIPEKRDSFAILELRRVPDAQAPQSVDRMVLLADVVDADTAAGEVLAIPALDGVDQVTNAPVAVHDGTKSVDYVFVAQKMPP